MLCEHSIDVVKWNLHQSRCHLEAIFDGGVDGLFHSGSDTDAPSPFRHYVSVGHQGSCGRGRRGTKNAAYHHPLREGGRGFSLSLHRGGKPCFSASSVTHYLITKEADVDYFRTFFALFAIL